MKVLHIDLWKCYLSYVRETKGKLPSYKCVHDLTQYFSSQRICVLLYFFLYFCSVFYSFFIEIVFFSNFTHKLYFFV